MDPDDGLAASMQHVLDRVRADAAGTGVAVDLHVAAGSGGRAAGGPPAGNVIATVVHPDGFREFPVDFTVGAEDACVEVMSAVQDAVVDTLWRPWPEVAAGVLDVGPGPGGAAYWLRRNTPIRPVGHLRATGSTGLLR